MDNAMKLQLMNWAKDAVDKGASYLSTLAQQYITWKTNEHFFWLGFGVLLLLVAAIAIFKENRYEERDRWDMEEGHGIVAWILSIAGSSIGTIIILTNIYWLIMIKTAPAVYIIESFSGN